MEEKKQQFLESLITLLELESTLNLDAILVYLRFYEIFSNDQISVIKNSKSVIREFVGQLIGGPDIGFERFAHALVLSQQWILFSILSGRELLDLSLLEEISKIHMELLLDRENKENAQFSYPNTIAFEDNSGAIDDHQIPEPSGILDNLEVDETDSKTFESLYNKDEVYPNFSSPKGLALIFNNREFSNNRFNPRTGTEIDEANLRKLLTKLGYQVQTTLQNLSAQSMYRNAKMFALSEYHRNYDSCVVVVLTHGEYDCFIGSDGAPLNVHEFLECFNAKNAKYLKGKPKLFFFQACRGDIHDYGTDSTDIGKISELFSCMRPSASKRNYNNNSKSNDLESEIFPSTSLPSSPTATTFPVASSKRFNSSFSHSSRNPDKRPTEGDMIIAFATTPRYVSWRNSNSGSWFIQSICEVFGKYAATEDIGSLLIRVNRRVAEVYQSTNHGEKQIPEHVNRLQKKFYFFPGIKSPPPSQ